MSQKQFCELSLKQRDNKVSKSRKSNSVRVDIPQLEEPDWIEKLLKANQRRPKPKIVAAYDALHTGLVRQILKYDDHSELYTYADEIEILSDHLAAKKVRGKFRAINKWEGDLICSYVDEFGQLMELNTKGKVRAHNDAIAAIWEVQKNIGASLRYAALNEKEEIEFSHKLEVAQLEERAISARSAVLERMEMLYRAKMPLNELFTMRNKVPRKKKSRSKTTNAVPPPKHNDHVGIPSESKRESIERIIRDKFKDLPKNKTVPGSVRFRILECLKTEKISLSKDALRTYLSRLGYCKPRH